MNSCSNILIIVLELVDANNPNAKFSRNLWRLFHVNKPQHTLFKNGFNLENFQFIFGWLQGHSQLYFSMTPNATFVIYYLYIIRYYETEIFIPFVNRFGLSYWHWNPLICENLWRWHFFKWLWRRNVDYLSSVSLSTIWGVLKTYGSSS